jgi:hypothetical protein
MKSKSPATDDELRMSAAEFDKMMRGALSAHAPKKEPQKHKSTPKRRVTKSK